MSELAAPSRLALAPIWRRLSRLRMKQPVWRHWLHEVATDADVAGESRAAHIQNAVDALFAPPHPHEFRCTYVRFWGEG